MMITETEMKRAEARMESHRKGGQAVSARYVASRKMVVVTLGNGMELAFPTVLAQGLEHARAGDLSTIEVTPSGLGLHFPKIDVDLYLPALMEGVMGSRKWMAAKLGRAGGHARSSAKAAASRENGKLGGRPRVAKTA